jgi:glutamate--cysteine ligase
VSQPRDSESENDALLELITDESSLEGVFTQFEKPRASFRIGVEHERFVVDPQSLTPIPWNGAKGMKSLLEDLLVSFKDEALTRVDDRGQTIGIMRPKSSITLEPGCQLELSGAPLETISEIDAELKYYESRLESSLDNKQLSSLLMGFHPTAMRADFEWVPKQRYAIMRRHMERKGTRGHDMMLRTCTVQGNFDYSSESDMIDSFRLGLLASPVVTALFASSPFKEGKPSGYLSERATVWHETDPDRCGFPLEVFENGFSYRCWITRVLDTPMYFVRRADVYHDATSITFREFMKNGFSGFKAIHRDFADHLTTIFTDARIKPQLEMRGADCGPKPFLRALPALWKGLLYNETSRRKALALLSSVDPQDLKTHQLEAAKNGLQAKYAHLELGVVASELVTLSREGLSKEESHYLKPLDEVIASGTNVAQKMLERFESSGGSFDWLLDPLQSPFA